MTTIEFGESLKIEEYVAKIRIYSSWRAIHKIRRKLNPRQLKKFEKTSFGHFLRVHNLQFSAQFCHQILLREVDVGSAKKELWFNMGDKSIRFSQLEFCLVTGLQFGNNVDYSCKIKDGLGHRIREVHFNDTKKILVETLEEYFDAYVPIDEQDDDIVKLALLLFLEVTLLGKDKRRQLDYFYMKLVDNLEAFNEFPWGSVVYSQIVRSLSKCCEDRADMLEERQEKNPNWKECYSIYGFVYAFQVWAFEAIPLYAENKFAKKISNEIPRILSWEAKQAPDSKGLKEKHFAEETVPSMQVLNPTEKERQQSYFSEFLNNEVPFQDPLVKRVDDLSSEMSSLKLEMSSQMQSFRDEMMHEIRQQYSSLKELILQTLVVKAPHGDSDDKEDDWGIKEGECEMKENPIEMPSLDSHLDSATETGPIGCSAKQSSSSLPTQIPVLWPSSGLLTPDWIHDLASIFDWSSKDVPPVSFPLVFPLHVFDNLLNTASKILHKEPNLVEIGGLSHESSVVIVGDIHGQLHDLLFLLRDAGFPSEDRFFVFNGDYVDRGAWGLETFLLLLAWKVCLPHRVCLLRGNHETKHCTSVYGFQKEVLTKYGDEGIRVYKKCLECFKELPLASRIAEKVYTAHGGLFRSMSVIQTKTSKQTNRRTILNPIANSLSLGSLEELSTARRLVLDAPWKGQNLIPGDVLWSDPSMEVGLSPNEERGIGLLWGPDCTEAFLKKSNLKLIIRSHEGPDARDKRSGLGGMDSGYTIDHDVESGKLITVFSAPDYPQFQETNDRYNNKGAYIILRAPDFDIPEFHSFEAVTPRPEVSPYYDFVDVTDSDDELDLASMMIDEVI